MKKTNQKSALRGLLTRLKPYTPHIIFTLLLAIATALPLYSHFGGRGHRSYPRQGAGAFF